MGGIDAKSVGPQSILDFVLSVIVIHPSKGFE